MFLSYVNSAIKIKISEKKKKSGISALPVTMIYGGKAVTYSMYSVTIYLE